jgi:aminoglycoside phosphotransferase (APT) family kinase protein
VPPRRRHPGRGGPGLLEPAVALDHIVSLEDATWSNPVTKVAVDGAPFMFAKQRGFLREDVDSLAVEAAACAWLDRVGLADLAPHLVASDVEGGILFFEALSPARSLQEMLIGGGSEIGAAFESLGHALGRLHSAPATASPLGLRRPWVLGLGHESPAVLPPSELVASIRGRILASRALAGLLSRLGESWAGRCVVHGDVKFDNVLVRASGTAGHQVRIWLIDWELAGLGEPEWDLAGVVEGVLTAQLMSLGQTDLESAGRLLRHTWQAYCGVVQLSMALSSLRAFTAARAAQAALQLAAMAASLPDLGAHAESVASLSISLASEADAWAAVERWVA